MPEQSKSEKRKEQNRRAQARHRKNRQQRLQYLEQQLGFLESLTGPAPDGTPFEFHMEDEQAPSQINLAHLPEQVELGATAIPHMDQHAFDMFPCVESTFEASYLVEQHFDETNSHPTCDDTGSAESITQSEPAPSRDVASQSHTPSSIDKSFDCIFDALASNAKLLGIPNEALIRATSGSSFFSPLSELDTSSIPPAFRPTMAQLTYQHHPYIDCIPVPHLRSRIVLALNHKPPLVDYFEIWYDLLRDGICSGPDPQDGSQWSMDEAFRLKWKTLLSYDMGTLLAQTLSSNPPLRVVFPNS